MKKLFTVFACVFLISSTLTSCYVNKFSVGKGAQSTVKVKKWNNYLIGGLIPIGVSDPVKMADGASDYNITIKHSFVNLLVSGITFGIYSPTTTVVEK
jgi:hypothetical protein